ncbi:MAG: precorrin-3B synthase [Xanthobacteraceae bacterium]
MIPHRRRGVCPSLAVPMPTGDGLLARLNLGGQTVSLDAAAALCEAAHRHGSGIIEVTSRGSVQVRGLKHETAPAFVDAIGKIDIDVPDGVPVAVSPLAGLAADEAIDAEALAAALRVAIGTAGLSRRIAPKVSVAIDSGSTLHLDALSADIRLHAAACSGDACLHLAMGGTAERAVPIGVVSLNRAADATVRLLNELAKYGEDARARNVVRLVGAAPFRAAIADLLTDGARAPDIAGPFPLPPRRPRSEPIGAQALRGGMLALGMGLPFGKVDVESLMRLIKVAQRVQAAGLRVAPDRALLIIGIRRDDAGALAADAAALGFITEADDRRRSIAACPGAPFCACTDVPTRTLAPEIASAAAALLDGSLVMHLSGCAKGCAHPGPAALTVVGDDGRCAVIVNGTPQYRPVVTLAPDALRASLARLSQTCASERLPGEGAAAVLSRLGARRIAAILSGASA